MRNLKFWTPIRSNTFKKGITCFSSCPTSAPKVLLIKHALTNNLGKWKVIKNPISKFNLAYRFEIGENWKKINSSTTTSYAQNSYISLQIRFGEEVNFKLQVRFVRQLSFGAFGNIHPHTNWSLGNNLGNSNLLGVDMNHLEGFGNNLTFNKFVENGEEPDFFTSGVKLEAAHNEADFIDDATDYKIGLIENQNFMDNDFNLAEN